MRRDRRQRTLRDWRARRASRGIDAGPRDRPSGRSRRRQRPATSARVSAGRLMAGARIVAGIAVVGILAVLALWFWRAPALRVTGATVRGNLRLPAEAVFAASALHGSHVLTADWRQAEGRVLSLGGFREARVRFDWPGAATIEVTETPAVLLWSAPAGDFAIDEQGLAVPPVGHLDGLPRVTDGTGLIKAIGERISPEMVAAAVAYSRRCSDLTYTSDSGFVGTSDHGWRVRLGADPSLADLQLAMLDAAAVQLSPDAGRVEVLDLRFATRPYYRLQEGAN